MVSMHEALLEARKSLTDNVARRQHSRGDTTYILKPDDHVKSGRYTWDDELLARFADILYPLLGPIAPVLVQRKAKTAADLNDLREELAKTLPDPSSRRQFDKQIAKQIASFTSPPVPQAIKTDGTQYGIDLSAIQIADIESALISHLGPITQTLVRRHALNASSLPQLFDTLSQHLNNNNDRMIFLQKMNKLFSVDLKNVQK